MAVLWIATRAQKARKAERERLGLGEGEEDEQRMAELGGGGSVRKAGF